jgi:hypothetical protein
MRPPTGFNGGRRITLLPPDERPVMKWNSNPFDIDGGSDGRGEDDGAAFLLPYWMGRYHGFCWASDFATVDVSNPIYHRSIDSAAIPGTVPHG